MKGQRRSEAHHGTEHEPDLALYTPEPRRVPSSADRLDEVVPVERLLGVDGGEEAPTKPLGVV